MVKHTLLKDYISGLLTCNKNYCHSLIIDAVNKGASIQYIYSHIFYPAMTHIGELWQDNNLSVAQEHFATAITQSIICSLYNKIFDEKSTQEKGKIVMTCANNELHVLGCRMVSDLLEMDGFDVNFLGANAPKCSLIEMIKNESPLVVGISCTMSFNINYVKDLILSIESIMPTKIPILVGGRAFDIDRRLVQYVGADYYAREFTQTIKLMNSIIPTNLKVLL